MEFPLGDFAGIIDDCQAENTQTQSEQTSNTVKLCEPKWFLTGSDKSDEDSIKFHADYLFFKGDIEKALKIYLELLTCERYGTSRSLVAELCESITICYKKLGDWASAFLYSSKSIEAGKNGDQQITNLYIKSRVLIASGDRDELLDCMRRLLLVHPYNHWLWLEMAHLHKEANIKAFYVLRTQVLLEINARFITSFVASKHRDLQHQVETELEGLAREIGMERFNMYKKLVQSHQLRERTNEDWLKEEVKMEVVNSSSSDIIEMFNNKWSSKVEGDHG